ncbi:bifunctional UDP-sugar hydrolase/5'-nucleotidase [Corynebacterium breve]|uniref:Bifunctional UDP-sugar hydrolase/5'-nucleotidase n=1 Tax=Corynebacterium breve TaxID=3049799 RepID=A0ABY8VN02_9CORY|nr:bifunctional UDP-sugar hydrolase/5'-nucleotidase [Corynebacterium breve]WIM68945.1 bifunctional UDP-sugar hydrolase/5'-nucleotidase [Corynebacterium breve]
MSKFRRMGHLIAAATTTALVAQGVVVAQAQEENPDLVTISISNFTDFHGHLESGIDLAELEAGQEMGAANIAALIEYVNQGSDVSIATTTGDNVGGSAFVSAISNDEYTLDALNAMGIDVHAAGNHEFDQGQNDLVNRIVPQSAPILAANVYKADGSRLLPASQVFDQGGVKVGIVGTTSNLTPQKVSPAGIEGLVFKDASEEANKEAQRLKESGEADIVIVLQHDPAEVDNLKLNAEYVDFLFGGDTHLQQLDTTADVPYAQSWDYGKMVSDLDITYNKATGEIVELTVEQYDATDFVALGLEPNAEVATIVAAAVAQAEELGSEVLATTTESFYRGSNPGETPGSNRGVESTANNMLAESNRQAMSDFLDVDIDLGLMNAGGVRSDLPAGDVTVEDAKTMQPFGNELVYATMSGAAIIKTLESQWQDPNSGRPRLSLGVSDNVSYVYDPTKPDGERITHVTINGEALDPAKDYTVATATFLFEGGDRHIDPADVRDIVNVGYLDVTAFSDYLKSGEAHVRQGQGEVGVVLPEGGLVAGETATIELSSLNYSSEGEPMAETVTVKLGDTEVTAEIDNSNAAKGYGENGKATIELAVPAGLSGEQTLTITTDAGTDISMPVTVGAGDTDTPGDDNKGSTSPFSYIITKIMVMLQAFLGTTIFAKLFAPKFSVVPSSSLVGLSSLR